MLCLHIQKHYLFIFTFHLFLSYFISSVASYDFLLTDLMHFLLIYSSVFHFLLLLLL